MTSFRCRIKGKRWRETTGGRAARIYAQTSHAETTRPCQLQGKKRTRNEGVRQEGQIAHAFRDCVRGSVSLRNGGNNGSVAIGSFQCQLSDITVCYAMTSTCFSCSHSLRISCIILTKLSFALLLVLFSYIVEDNKAIFMLKDGSKAWQVKDFLIQQERCQQVVIDDETYAGLKSTPPSSSSSSNQTDEFWTTTAMFIHSTVLYHIWLWSKLIITNNKCKYIHIQ